MNDTKWIMSEGGPLIGMEAILQPYWGGICRLTVPQAGAQTDYDRPPARLSYIQHQDMQSGAALVFGEGPLDTAFWRRDELLFIVRVKFCEPDFDIARMMAGLDLQILKEPCESLQFCFHSKEIVIFDSAEDGSNYDKENISSSIRPGCYRILTHVYTPDERASFILHSFDLIRPKAVEI